LFTLEYGIQETVHHFILEFVIVMRTCQCNACNFRKGWKWTHKVTIYYLATQKGWMVQWLETVSCASKKASSSFSTFFTLEFLFQLQRLINFPMDVWKTW